jgi:hypothetical protein
MESSDNGDLDGMWQLARIDTLMTGNSADMRYSQVVWCMQGTLLETRIADHFDMEDDVIFRFSLTGDSLKLYSPYFSYRNLGDVKVEDARLLHPFGITRLEERFLVQQLSSSDMQLQSDSLRLYFHKY